jgi:hypothetical protein
LARPIVLIPYLFRLADAINFRKDYSPSASLPSRPYTRGDIRRHPLSSLRWRCGAGRPNPVALLHGETGFGCACTGRSPAAPFLCSAARDNGGDRPDPASRRPPPGSGRDGGTNPVNGVTTRGWAQRAHGWARWACP